MNSPTPALIESELTAAERQRLLIEWNATGVDYPRDRCLHELIEAQAERCPQAPAVVFEGDALSYAELNGWANGLAHAIRRHRVGPDALVGICAERSLAMVVGLLAILKSGGAYVPLDPSCPKARLAQMLQDARPRVMLTQRAVAQRLPEHSAPVIDLEDRPPAREDAPASGVQPRNLAYVIYTSGSTGIPKGAMNEHLAVCNRLLWMQDAYRLTSADRVLQKTPFSFDVSVWEFFWPLLSGACLVVARPGGHQDPAYLAALIRQQRITTLHFVPPMLKVFLEQPGVEQCTSLKRIICSGEALPFDLQQRCFARLDAELYNLYGPTETAIDVTSWTCRRGAKFGTVPIGRPIANTRIYILDDRCHPVPIGVPGELCIGGIAVGRGYLNRPELTAEKFISDPFSPPNSGARLYRTGDLARYRADGSIEFLGRLDHQVKVRGLRIEPGEIETVLRRHPAVHDAAVLAREDAAGDKRLVAYVVPALEAGEGGQSQHAAALVRTQAAQLWSGPASNPGQRSAAHELVPELRRLLAEKLPEPMVPSAFVLLERMPLTANGKLDRRALPPPDDAWSDPDRDCAAPRNELERHIARCWQAILAIKPCGAHDNFFDLGGDSIKGAVFINDLQEQLGEAVSVAALFNAPTVADFAQYLTEHYPAAISRLTAPAAAPLGLETAPSARAPSQVTHIGQFQLEQLSDAEVDALLRQMLSDRHR